MSTMTSRERNELISLCRTRARLAKQVADQRAAELLADFEAQLATEYAWDDDETWTEANRIAEAALADANGSSRSAVATSGSRTGSRHPSTTGGSVAARMPSRSDAPSYARSHQHG
jgi:hypothetical protein